MATFQDNGSILIYRVGPVLCCAPCLSVLSISHPAPLTKLPGQKAQHSGIFKFGSKLVNVCELRENFGVVPEQWCEPGRVIITELSSGNVGFWVDEIIDVMESPSTGWGNPPPLIPKATFSRTLTLKNKIHLYAEFENLYAIKQIGYLKSYIEHLDKLKLKNETISKNKAKNTNSDSEITRPKNISTENKKEVKSQNKNNTITKIESTETNKPDAISNITHTSISKKPSLTANSLKSKLQNKVTTLKKPVLQKDNSKTKNINVNITNTVKSKNNYNKVINTKINHSITNKTEQINKLENNSTNSYSPNESDDSNIVIFIGIAFLVFLLIGGIIFTQFDKPKEPNKYVSNESITSIFKIKNTEHIYTNPDETKDNIDNIDLNNKATLTNQSTDTISDYKNNNNSAYSAKITKNENNITITIHTSVSENKYSELKSDTKSILDKSETKTNVNNNPQEYKIAILASNTQNPSQIAPSSITKKIIHIVVKGDTLWDIAKFYVEDPYRYPELARLSNIKNPDLIYPGNQVHIIYIFTNGHSQNE